MPHSGQKGPSEMPHLILFSRGDKRAFFSAVTPCVLETALKPNPLCTRAQMNLKSQLTDSVQAAAGVGQYVS